MSSAPSRLPLAAEHRRLKARYSQYSHWRENHSFS